MYLNIDFYDEEWLDGYFSGVLAFIDGDRRIILDFGYDAEFKQLKLRNCMNPVFNSTMQTYEPNDIAEIYRNHGVLIVAEIQAYLLTQHSYTTPKEDY